MITPGPVNPTKRRSAVVLYLLISMQLVESTRPQKEKIESPFDWFCVQPKMMKDNHTSYKLNTLALKLSFIHLSLGKF